MSPQRLGCAQQIAPKLMLIKMVPPLLGSALNYAHSETVSTVYRLRLLNQPKKAPGRGCTSPKASLLICKETCGHDTDLVLSGPCILSKPDGNPEIRRRWLVLSRARVRAWPVEDSAMVSSNTGLCAPLSGPLASGKPDAQINLAVCISLAGTT